MLKTLRKNRMDMFFLLLIVETMASNFAHPVTPTLLKELNVHDYMFGISFASMALAQFVFSPFWGMMIRRYSSRNVMCVGCFGYAFGQFLFMSAGSELAIAVARFVGGTFIGGVSVGMLTYTVNLSDEEFRGRNLAINAAIGTIASAFGFLIGGLLGEITVKTSFYAQFITLGITSVLFRVLLVDDGDLKEVGIKKSFTEYLKEANPFSAFLTAKEFMTATVALLFVVVFLANVGTNAYDQCFNYYIKDQFGFTSSYNGVIKAVTGIMALVSNLTICMRLLRSRNVPKATAGVLLCCAASMIGVVFISSQIPFIVVVLVFYAFNSVYIPLLQDCASRSADAKNSNMVMAFYNSVKSLGMIGGALTAGFIYSYSPKSPFTMAFAAFTLAAFFMVLYSNRKQKEN